MSLLGLFYCGSNIEKSAACGRALVKNHALELELFNLGVELVLVLVVGKHFVAVGECAAQRIAKGRFSLDLLVDFRNDVVRPSGTSQTGRSFQAVSGLQPAYSTA